MKKLKQAEARVAKKCPLCPTTWQVGDKIFMVIDILQDKMTDIICLTCGQEKFEQQEGSNQIPTTNNQSEVVQLLREILAELKILTCKEV